MMDRNQSWPTGWPNAIDEKQFKIDIPLPDRIFQSMIPEGSSTPVKNVSFTRNIDALLTSISLEKDSLNVFHYLVVAYMLLGRTAELVHSIHDDPGSPEYIQDCENLDNYVVKLRLSIPRAGASVFEASIEDRGQVVWLNAILNTILLLLHFRAVPYSDPVVVKQLFEKTVTAAKDTSQTIKDASRTSVDLLLNIHIASSLYMGE